MHPRTPGLLLYQCVFWILILLPFDFSAPPPLAEVLGPQILAFETAPGTFVADLIRSVGHAALFFPLAPLLAWGSARALEELLSVKTLAFVLLLALGSEIAQLTVGRGTSVPDGIMNFVGYAAGVLAVSVYSRSPRLRSSLKRLAPGTASCGLVSVLAVLSFLLLPSDGLPLGPRALSNWDAAYPLVIGNSRTRVRPWLGRIERVEIRATGPASTGPEDRSAVACAYDFSRESLTLRPSGNVQRVLAQIGPPLEVPGHYVVVPHPAGGIELPRPGVLWTRKSNSKSIDRIRKSGRFSVKVRFQPRDLSQTGPARIVTLSLKNQSRNFTLGQEGDALELRVQTVLTGSSGEKGGYLRTPSCLKAGQATTVVAGYARGVLAIYVDGKLQAWSKLDLLSWLSYHAFGAALGPGVALGLSFVGWAACFVFLLVLCRWRGLGGGRGVLVAGAAAGVLLLLAVLLASALTPSPPPEFGM